jgi:hypothetical protein
MEYVQKNSQVYDMGSIRNSESSGHFHFKFKIIFFIWSRKVTSEMRNQCGPAK